MTNTTKTIQELNLSDSFLFAKVMDDKEICRKVLGKILGIPIQKVSMPDGQRTADIPHGSQGIQRYAYSSDAKDTVYNVKVECLNQHKAMLPQMARYYEESMDSGIISAGLDCGKLKKSYVIFICSFDPFTEGRHIYTFENRCREYPSLSLGDEATKIFLNTKGTVNDVDQEMLDFLTYMENTADAFVAQAASPLVREIHKRVTEIKQNKDMADEYADFAMSLCKSIMK